MALWLSWMDRGACAGSGEAMHPSEKRREREIARRVCRGMKCEVINECLAWALDHDPQAGVWGGTTERERRVLKRQEAPGTNWRELLVS